MPSTRSQIDAAQKARQLLLRLLTPEQLADYQRLNLVVVRGLLATYEIGAHSLVIAQRDGREFALCIQFAHPADGAWLPAEDLMIAKLLLIRTDEDGLWKRFGPPPYRESPVAEWTVPHGFVFHRFVFGRGELLMRPPPHASTVMITGSPVHFTENLEPLDLTQNCRCRLEPR